MRLLVVASVVGVVLLVGFVAVRLAQALRLFPAGSSEVVELTDQKRVTLARLLAEKKFGPNEFPPLGYTGAATPEDAALATSSVNKVISAVLAGGSPVRAKVLSDLIGRAMREVDQLDTEDRDRTAGYLIEIWYILGFKGATGRFAYGSAFPRPAGYGEPLPPGWIAPDKPRPIEPPQP